MIFFKCHFTVELRIIPDLKTISSNTVSGRLEMKYNGVWGTVCKRGFDKEAAKVACRQLGIV